MSNALEPTAPGDSETSFSFPKVTATRLSFSGTTRKPVTLAPNEVSAVKPGPTSSGVLASHFNPAPNGRRPKESGDARAARASKTGLAGAASLCLSSRWLTPIADFV
jgi:hypothetical protein